MTQTALSKNGFSIRLTDERWLHITEEHCELAGLRLEVIDTIEEPERIAAGAAGERLAIRSQPDGEASCRRLSRTGA